ncbi:hypothetical protein BKA70DRAFT_1313786 [Coprinopsis sp. MPI-PUGE-AT-0042]|nr:hypothetical protein BKA70DRAFT_1313786 [Coprinopsis sp. MPI-PUGE-AT-0042]
MTSRTPNMLRCRPVELPLDIIGIIAGDVACKPASAQRTQTLMNCMLVSRSFADEFRRYLFAIFHINDCAIEDLQETAERLSTHAVALVDHPEYQKFVKTVTISLEVANTGFSISDVLDFRWLTSVTSISLKCKVSAFNFALIAPHSRDAIVNVCSLPSIHRMTFDQVDNLPPQLFQNAPSLKYLSLHSTTMVGSSQEGFIDFYSRLSATSTPSSDPPIHLEISHYHSFYKVTNALPALIPILNRVWKLTGRPCGPLFLSMIVLGARDALEDLDLTFSDTHGPNGKGINAADTDISPAKHLQRLTFSLHVVND